MRCSHGALTCGLVLTLAGCGSTPQPEPRPDVVDRHPTRVLFVGNSFTFWHGGLWRYLPALSKEVGLVPGYEASRVVRGGASLEVMWSRTRATEEIASGKWDVVVLQEDIPETSIESFRKYSRLFVEAVRAAGARPILFMAWEYDRLGWITMDEIASAHRQVAAELDVEVAPVGLAWKRSRSKRPDLDMYARDREHPSSFGTFLSLCVIEATISGAAPRRLEQFSIMGHAVPPDDLAFLHTVADETLLSWKEELPKSQ